MRKMMSLLLLEVTGLCTILLLWMCCGCEPTTKGQEADTSVKPSRPPAGMVLIPAGEFQMGSADEDASSNEQPVHTVHVDAFYMDKYEVTNAQFKKFVDANPQWQKDGINERSYTDFGIYLFHWRGNNYPSGKANHPVKHVTWYAAMAYAEWAGKRLPTEAEWEYAARGGLAGKKYPWGNTISPADANYSYNVDDTTPVGQYSPTPVGQYSPNGYGLYDMAGNVAEWCLDPDSEGFYARVHRGLLPRRNPFPGEMTIRETTVDYKTVSEQDSRVLRGGSWDFPARHVRVASRLTNPPTSVGSFSGFRCVRDVTP